jgi:hypothetical protein
MSGGWRQLAALGRQPSNSQALYLMRADVELMQCYQDVRCQSNGTFKMATANTHSTLISQCAPLPRSDDVADFVV